MRTIDISVDGGSLLGYVVSAQQPNLLNYLQDHTAHADAIMRVLRSSNETVALLRNMSVVDGSRGQGIGNELVGQFFSEAEASGATAFILICDALQDQDEGFDLQAWYETFGFERCTDDAESPFMAMPEDVAATIMQACAPSKASAPRM